MYKTVSKGSKPGQTRVDLWVSKILNVSMLPRRAVVAHQTVLPPTAESTTSLPLFFGSLNDTFSD
eukprot:COSAG02_NODE_559_length_20335_cov_10.631894_19_plen_65_part_00